MMKTFLKKLLYISPLIFLFLCGWAFFYVYHLNRKLNQTIQNGWFLPSIEYYSAPLSIPASSSLSKDQWIQHLIQRNYKAQKQLEQLKNGEFIFLESCKDILLKTETPCLFWINSSFQKNLVVFSSSHQFYQGSNHLNPVTSLSLDPILFTQHEGDSILLRKKVKLNEVPVLCLQSITIAEDQNFLIHKGASFSGMARAFLKNLKHLRIKEGGSTITQQLIKNKFLSPERTFRRKLVELIMSLMLETKLTKDQILELYLNTIYMGRSESSSIYGFASASQYYFNKTLSQTTLPECALLSIIVQSPGRFNPFLHPQRAQAKRDLVLRKLFDSKYISNNDLALSLQTPLPSSSQKISARSSSSYFVQAIYKKVKEWDMDQQDLAIYSTINLEKQIKAQKAITKALRTLNPRAQAFSKEINKEDFTEVSKEISEEDTHELETSLIHVDLETNEVQALVGGRNFNESPFNRAMEAYRPIGSLVKPFIFLSALANRPSLNPLSPFIDEPFDENAKWSPKNYKDRYYGEVPLYFALSHSLNSVSVRLGSQVGLDTIIRNLKKLGLRKDLLKVSSITLGAIDLSLWEVSQMYSTIARMGSFLELSMIQSIKNSNDQILFQNKKVARQVFSKEKVAVLIGMMKQVMASGTAQWVQEFYPHPSAGKTGTSNEERDSWFIGFTPKTMTAIWVGYDNNKPHGLTGASGALLVWLYFMQSLNNKNQEGFKWPRKVAIKNIPPFQSEAHPSENPQPTTIPLVFEKKSTWYDWFSR